MAYCSQFSRVLWGKTWLFLLLCCLFTGCSPSPTESEHNTAVQDARVQEAIALLESPEDSALSSGLKASINSLNSNLLVPDVEFVFKKGVTRFQIAPEYVGQNIAAVIPQEVLEDPALIYVIARRQQKPRWPFYPLPNSRYTRIFRQLEKSSQYKNLFHEETVFPEANIFIAYAEEEIRFLPLGESSPPPNPPENPEPECDMWDETNTFCIQLDIPSADISAGTDIPVSGMLSNPATGHFAVSVLEGNGTVADYQVIEQYDTDAAFSFELDTTLYSGGTGYRIRIAWWEENGSQKRSRKGLWTSDDFTITPRSNSDTRIFTKPLFDFFDQSTTHQTSERTDTIRLQAAPGEFEPATFFVKARENSLSNVSITTQALTDWQERQIAADNIDIRCVKVWPQAGQGKFPEYTASNPLLLPELLLHDCTENLTGTFLSDKHYVPPTISKDLRADIEQGESQQFWVTVNVPKNTAPGIYKGLLTISAANGFQQEVILAVEVLDIHLREPDHVFALYYAPYLWEEFPQERLEAELRDIREHGFTGLRLSGPPEHLDRVLAVAKNLGFTGPIIGKYGSNKCDKLLPVFEKYDYEPICYGQDEPNRLHEATASHSLRHHIWQSDIIKDVGAKVATTIRKEISDLLDTPSSEAYDQVNPDPENIDGKTFRQMGMTDHALDLAIYHAENIADENPNTWKRDLSFWEYIESLRNGAQKAFDRLELYYWQAWKDTPHLNRLMSGFFLWTSKHDGISAYIYQEPPSTSGRGDPFDDFDSVDQGALTLRDLMITYPSADEPIPTLKWEEFREGIDDIRYLTTFFDLLERLESENTTRAQELKSIITTELEKYMDPRNLTNLNGEDFSETRRKLQLAILEAQEALSNE